MVRTALGKSCGRRMHMSVGGNLGLLPLSCPGACGFVEEVEARSRAGGDSRRSSTAQLSPRLQISELNDIFLGNALAYHDKLVVLSIIGEWVLGVP